MRNFTLDRDAPGSLQEQLREEILHRIRVGVLRPGEKLPPSRQLADQLGVHRGTVSAVYEELRESGALVGQVGRGTFVAGTPVAASANDGGGRRPFRWRDHFVDTSTLPPERALLARAMAEGEDAVSFASLVPDEAFFPTEAFRRAVTHVLKEEGASLLSYGPPSGHEGFVTFLQRHLAEERNVVLPASELLVFNGSQQALDLLSRAFLRPGDTVVVEEPSYYGAMDLFRANGARLVGVPADEHGMRVDELERTIARERPKLIYVMPTFQNPTGSCLGEERRAVLVELAARYEVPVIEDDFDGELYFGEPPLPPVKSLPGTEGVIYIGTPSKMLFPGLRIGWIAAAEPVVRHLSRLKRQADLSGSQVLQAALARFAETGSLRKHMAVVRKAYGDRLQTLLTALEKHMPDGVTWTTPRGGLALLVTLPEGLDSSSLLPESAREGVLYSPGRMFFVGDGARTLRLAYGNVPTQEVDAGVERLSRVVRRAMGRDRRQARRPATVPPV